MELPILSRPIQRATASRPYANRGISDSSTADTNAPVPAYVSVGAQGVETSFDWGGLLSTVAGALGI
jgi:hypothetical protein